MGKARAGPKPEAAIAGPCHMGDGNLPLPADSSPALGQLSNQWVTWGYDVPDLDRVKALPQGGSCAELEIESLHCVAPRCHTTRGFSSPVNRSSQLPGPSTTSWSREGTGPVQHQTADM
ncbi:unnamed protein product [Lota lota]